MTGGRIWIDAGVADAARRLSQACFIQFKEAVQACEYALEKMRSDGRDVHRLRCSMPGLSIDILYSQTHGRYLVVAFTIDPDEPPPTHTCPDARKGRDVSLRTSCAIYLLDDGGISAPSFDGDHNAYASSYSSFARLRIQRSSLPSCIDDCFDLHGARHNCVRGIEVSLFLHAAYVAKETYDATDYCDEWKTK